MPVAGAAWRRLPILWFAVYFGVALTPSRSSARSADVPSTVPTAKPPAPPAKVEIPFEQRPYGIKSFVTADVSSGLDRVRLDSLIGEWRVLVHRFVGAPWQVEVMPSAPESLTSADPSSLKVEAFAGDWPEVDKVWLIKIRGEGGALAFEGREFDVATRRLGPFQRLGVPVLHDAPRVFLRFTLDLFSPSATVGEHFGKGVGLVVQGGAIEPASEIGRVVSKGMVFQPLRIVQKKDKSTFVQEIPLTYLQVEKADGPNVSCSLVSSFRDPFTKRFIQKNWLVAVGIKPGKSPTRLRFTILPDKAPAAGYVLTAKRFPDGTVRDVGTTDRQGRLTLEPGDADGLTIFRIIAGSSEPMREFPMMPGVSDVEQAIPAFDPLPITIALETQIGSLRDVVIDMVAIRARLEAQLKGRYDSEDFPGAEESLKVYRALPPRSKYSEELASLKKNAALDQSKSKSPVLTKTVQAQFAEVEALIDHYLDDEGFLAYAEALDKVKAGAKAEAAKVQKKAADKSASPAVAAPKSNVQTPTAKPAAPAVPPKAKAPSTPKNGPGVPF